MLCTREACDWLWRSAWRGVLLCLFLAVLGGVGGVRAAPGDCAVPGAYATIQAAVSNPACTQVLVAAGTYNENVVITRNIVLSGAGAATTIINGGGNGPVIRVRNGAAPTIQGFTITGGDASGHLGCGGGVSIVNAAATVRDNVIRNNVASSDGNVPGWGGGVCAMTGTATVHIYNNTVQNNAAFSTTTTTLDDPGRGGGIGIWRRHSTVVITGNRILTNVAVRMPPTNAVWGGGGGILSDADVANVVENNVIQGNVANSAAGTASGGGVCLHFGTVTFNHNYVLNNLGVHTQTDMAWGNFVAGGGVVLYGPPTATVRGNWIMTNTGAVVAQSTGSPQNVWAGGGGLSISDIDSVANDRVVVEDNRIIANTLVHTLTTSGADSKGHSEGGGLRVDQVANVIVNGNEVRHNMAVRSLSQGDGSGSDDWGGRPAGGGIYISDCGAVTMNENSVLSNTTAYRQEVQQVSAASEGGGIYLQNLSTASLNGNTVQGNKAARTQVGAGDTSDEYELSARGGGVCVSNAGVVTMTGNQLLRNNSVTIQTLNEMGSGNRAGGLWFDNIGRGTVQSNIISGNWVVDEGTITASSGRNLQAYGGGIMAGGDCNLTFIGNHILDNVGGYDLSGSGSDYGFDIMGGGVSLEMQGPVVFRSNVVSGNLTSENTWSGGGGVELWSGAQVDMARNLILGNRAPAGSGGGIYVGNAETVLTSTNDIVARNSSGVSVSECRASFVNDTIYDNGEYGVSASDSSETVTISNTIIANHGIGLTQDGGGSGRTVADYNLLQNTNNYQGAVTTGTHTILNQDPKFVNAAADNFRLQAGSPATDKASPAWAPAIDFYGVLRPQGPLPDIGAAEGTERRVHLPVIRRQ